MTVPPDIRAILFDLGDTLIDFEPMDTRAMFRLACRNGYDHLCALGVELPRFERFVREQHRALRRSYLLAKLRGREFDSLTMLRRLCRQLQYSADEEALHELAWLWYRPLVDHASVPEGSIDALRRFQRAGLPMGIVSNTFIPGPTLDRHLRHVGLLDLFPVRIYSSDTGYRKPHRRIFQMALSALGTEPANTLFVGDLVKADIRGARRVGMPTALRQPWASPTAASPATFTIRRIADLVDLLLPE